MYRMEQSAQFAVLVNDIQPMDDNEAEYEALLEYAAEEDEEQDEAVIVMNRHYHSQCHSD